jgi:chemotaxis protein histidine kinase CheA
MFKKLAKLIGDTPWWLLLLGGLGVIVVTAVATSQTGAQKLVHTARTPEMKVAVAREIKKARELAVLDIGRAAIMNIDSFTGDPEVRAQLKEALEQIEQAKKELNQQKQQVEAAKLEGQANLQAAAKERQAAQAQAELAVKQAEDEVAKATRRLDAAKIKTQDQSAADAKADIADAARDVEHAERDLAQAKGEADRTRREVESASKSTVAEQRAAQREADKALQQAEKTLARAQRDLERKLAGVEKKAEKGDGEANTGAAKDAPLPPTVATDGADKKGETTSLNDAKGGNSDPKKGAHRGLKIDIGASDLADLRDLADLPPLPPGTVLPQLPAELKTLIGTQVHSDIRRVGIGITTVVVLTLLYITLIIAKSVISVNRALKARAAWSEKEAHQASLSRQLMEAKLAAMQAQIEPHFLFNTLASVDHLIETDPAAASRMQKNLIAYLRAAIPQMRESSTTLAREAELCRAYLNILQVRMESRLRFEIAIPDELKNAPFPPMMLPTLVENAIKHGLEPQPAGGEIKVSAMKQNGTLKVSVADTGSGFSESAGNGVGLTNIRERLQALYDGKAGLTIEPNSPQGTIVSIEIPDLTKNANKSPNRR